MKSALYLLIFALMTDIFGTLAEEEQCDSAEIHNCFQSMEAILERQFSSLKKTENELDVFCGELKRNAKCLMDAPAKCKESRPQIEDVSEALDKYFGKFCEPDSEDRKLYLDNVPCLLQNQPSFEKCSSTGQAEGETEEEISKAICNEHRRMVNCFTKTSKEKCGKPAEKLVAALMDPLNAVLGKQCNSGRYIQAAVYFVIAAAAAVHFLP